MTVEERLTRHFQDSVSRQSFTDPQEAYRRWQESAYVSADPPPPPSERRWVRPSLTALSAAIILAVVAVATLNSRDGAPEPVEQRAVEPGDERATVAVTAALGWQGGHTDGWAYQHPGDWKVSTGAKCGESVVIVLLASGPLDACDVTGATLRSGSDVAFAAVIETPLRSGGGDGGVPTTSPAPTGSGSIETVFEIASGDRTTRVVTGSAGGDAQRAVLARAVALTIVSPRTDRTYPHLGSTIPGGEPLLERVEETQDQVGFPVLLPTEMPPNFFARSIDVGTDVVSLELMDGDSGTPRMIQFCSGRTASSHGCDAVATNAVERTYAGAAWQCWDAPHIVKMSCRRSAPDGTWISFRVLAGTFSEQELETMLSSLSTDLTGAAWLE